jgi:hypothetical protein
MPPGSWSISVMGWRIRDEAGRHRRFVVVTAMCWRFRRDRPAMRGAGEESR